MNSFMIQEFHLFLCPAKKRPYYSRSSRSSAVVSTPKWAQLEKDCLTWTGGGKIWSIMFLSADCSAVPSPPRRRSAAVNSHCLQEQWNILSQQAGPDAWTLLTIYSLPSPIVHSLHSVERRGVCSDGAARTCGCVRRNFRKSRSSIECRQNFSTGLLSKS